MKLQCILHPGYADDYLSIPTLGVFVKDKTYELNLNNRVVRHYLQNGFFVVIKKEKQKKKRKKKSK